MPKQSSVLEVGASLGQALEAYFDYAPLDHDDDIGHEAGSHVFDDVDESAVNTTMYL